MFLLLSTEWCYLMGVPVSFVSTWIPEIWMWPDTTTTYLSGLVVVPHPQIYDHHTHISPWRVVGLFVQHPHTHDPHTERYSEKPTDIRPSSSWDTLRDLNMHRVFRFDIFLKVPNWSRHYPSSFRTSFTQFVSQITVCFKLCITDIWYMLVVGKEV